MEGVECCSVEPHGLAIEQHKRVARAEQRLDDKWQQKSAATKNYWNTFFLFSFLILIVSIKKKGAEGRKKKMENGAYGQKKEMHSQIYFLFIFFLVVLLLSFFFVFKTSGRTGQQNHPSSALIKTCNTTAN